MRKKKPEDHEAHPVDAYVGARIRTRRTMLNLSDAELGRRIGGMSPQQIQKYQRAENRVSAGKLYDLAIALEIPVEWFFEGLQGNNYTSAGVSDLDPDQERLLEDYAELTSDQKASVRHVVLAMRYPNKGEG